MSTTTAVAAITANELLYAPAVLAGVQAAEAAAASAPGETKAQAVLDGIMAGSAQLAQSNVPPAVGGIAALINLTVAILNGLGIFRKKTPVSATVAAVA